MKPEKGKIEIERVGGLAGFGSAHLKSMGSIELEELSEEEQKAVKQLFRTKGSKGPSQNRDTFRYKIKRSVGDKTETTEVEESEVPDVVKAAVKDTLI